MYQKLSIPFLGCLTFVLTGRMATEDQLNEYNEQLVSRQIEINEWTYNDKMETLFVYQLLFIGLLISCLVMLMKSVGAVGGMFAWYVVGLTALLMALVIANRASFTKNLRDRRYWNRIRFDGDGALPTVMTDEQKAAYITSVKASNNAAGAADGSCVPCPNAG